MICATELVTVNILISSVYSWRTLNCQCWY
jgi:hypothetical protein